MTRALLLLAASSLCLAQIPEAATKPLPDTVALMREVEAHQKATEALERDYLFHSFAITKTLDSHGNLKKTETEDSEIFYVAGTRIRRMLKKDGKDLSPEEQSKETRRIDKEIAKAKEDQGNGKSNNGRDEVTVSRFLALGSFFNARRVMLNDRDTIAIDFVGNPKAKPESRFEGAIREMAGTVWVDERDRALRKLEGNFLHDFKIGGGLVAEVKQGSPLALSGPRSTMKSGSRQASTGAATCAYSSWSPSMAVSTSPCPVTASSKLRPRFYLPQLRRNRKDQPESWSFPCCSLSLREAECPKPASPWVP